jgi:hypothetical protein
MAQHDTKRVQDIYLQINRGSGGAVHPIYQGPYDVEPMFEVQTLETKGRLLNRDVTVNEIYVGRVINPQGGNTITIGV